MRIKVNFTKNTTPVPIVNQAIMNSYTHKCLGPNNKYHDTPSDYCISSLMGGKLDAAEQTLSFEKGGYIIISSLDQEFIDTMILGIIKNQTIGFGMKFCGIDHIQEKFYNGYNKFATLSPFIIKIKEGDESVFVTLHDPDFEEILEEYLKFKINKIKPNWNLKHFRAYVPDNDTHKVKTIMVKNVKNLANQCHVVLDCNKEVAELLYNIGIGKSTGSGFGTIYTVDNHHIYRDTVKKSKPIRAAALERPKYAFE